MIREIFSIILILIAIYGGKITLEEIFIKVRKEALTKAHKGLPPLRRSI